MNLDLEVQKVGASANANITVGMSISLNPDGETGMLRLYFDPNEMQKHFPGVKYVTDVVRSYSNKSLMVQFAENPQYNEHGFCRAISQPPQGRKIVAIPAEKIRKGTVPICSFNVIELEAQIRGGNRLIFTSSTENLDKQIREAADRYAARQDFKKRMSPPRKPAPAVNVKKGGPTVDNRINTAYHSMALEAILEQKPHSYVTNDTPAAAANVLIKALKATVKDIPNLELQCKDGDVKLVRTTQYDIG